MFFVEKELFTNSHDTIGMMGKKIHKPDTNARFLMRRDLCFKSSITPITQGVQIHSDCPIKKKDCKKEI